MSSRMNLGEKLISSPTHQSACARPSAKASSRMRFASMKRCKQDEELANTNPQPFPSNEPSPETLEAIREGDAFFATGECGRFDNGADLIKAALKAPHSRPANE